jgi:hypothetical protein
VSATTVVTDVVAILGVLGVGSILGQYIGSSKDRREARAQVLGALSETETHRWVGPEDIIPWADFHAHMRKLQIAALIARLPRDAVWEYAVLAQAARRLSEESWERDPRPEGSGGVDKHLADATREAARTISTLAWTWGPTHAWRWRRAKKRIDELLSRLQLARSRSVMEESRSSGFL